MDQSGQMFIPGLLAGRAGQDVEFRSSEDILHNVRVDYGAGEPIFNVATPPWGKYVHKLERPGFYNVSCDIHTTMRATIYLSDAPYVVAVPDSGEFVFQNIRHGAYKVSGYIQGNPIDKKVEVTGLKPSSTCHKPRRRDHEGTKTDTTKARRRIPREGGYMKTGRKANHVDAATRWSTNLRTHEPTNLRTFNN